MNKNKLDLTLALGLLLAVVLACGATTANISSLKVSMDEEGKNQAKSFKPGDKVYAVAQIANNSGTVQAKFRVLYDDCRRTNRRHAGPGRREDARCRRRPPGNLLDHSATFRLPKRPLQS